MITEVPLTLGILLQYAQDKKLPLDIPISIWADERGYVSYGCIVEKDKENHCYCKNAGLLEEECGSDQTLVITNGYHYE